MSDIVFQFLEDSEKECASLRDKIERLQVALEAILERAQHAPDYGYWRALRDIETFAGGALEQARKK